MDQRQSPYNWYVLYTMPRSEKKVASQILSLGMESFLPTHSVIRQWSDRKKKLEMPLFPGYVFVKTCGVKTSAVLRIKQVVNLVSIEKKPVVVRESEIALIQRVVNKEESVEHEEYMQAGDKVVVVQGELAGVEGIIINKQGRMRLLLRVEGIARAFSINISANQVQLA